MAGQSCPELGELWVHPETENPLRKGLQYYLKSTHTDGKRTQSTFSKELRRQKKVRCC